MSGRFWDKLAHGALTYDIVITKQLMASAEYFGMDVHSALRGGITVGTTSYKPGRTVSHIRLPQHLSVLE